MTCACSHAHESEHTRPVPLGPARDGVSAVTRVKPDQVLGAQWEYPVMAPNELLDSRDVVVVRGTAITPVASEQGSRIYTWQELEVHQVLKGLTRSHCDSPSAPEGMRPGTRDGGRFVAMPLLGGSVSDETGRTIYSGDAGALRFRAGETYLVFGTLCGDVLELSYGTQGLFTLRPDARVEPFLRTEHPALSQRTILTLATIERIAMALGERPFDVGERCVQASEPQAAAEVRLTASALG
jgi:hypothetical protein